MAVEINTQRQTRPFLAASIELSINTASLVRPHRSPPPKAPGLTPGLTKAPPTRPPLAELRLITARLPGAMAPTPGLIPLIAGAPGGLRFGRTGAARGATATLGARLPPGRLRTMTPRGLFRSMKTLQKFSSVHAQVHNHFNQERNLVTGRFTNRDARPHWQSGPPLGRRLSLKESACLPVDEPPLL
jgi:hypothetical protein